MSLLAAAICALIIGAFLIIAWPFIRLPRTDAGDIDMTALAIFSIPVAAAFAIPFASILLGSA